MLQQQNRFSNNKKRGSLSLEHFLSIYIYLFKQLIESVCSLFILQLTADESAEQTAQFKKISSVSRFTHQLQQ